MIKIAIVYKTKGNYGPYSAGGLAANALHSVAVLREMGFDAQLVPVKDFSDLTFALSGFTHVIVEAVWLTVDQLLSLSRLHPHTHFVVRAHSKMGFLQVEPEAISTMRQIMALKEITLASNNAEFAGSLSEVYGHCLYLPNLYDLNSSPPRDERCGPLRIASFGASRLLKLHPSAGLAALQIAKRLGDDLEFYVNVDRTPGGESVRKSVRALFADLPHARLIEVPWQAADEFKSTIATMDLVLQLSCTETFCLVAADAVASGVPVIAGPAISWLPDRAKVADVDNTSQVADLGVHFLSNGWWDRRAEKKALTKFVGNAKKTWAKHLTH